MGRLTRRTTGVQFSSRVTWTFTARTARGRSRHIGRVTAAGRALTAALLRGALTRAAHHRHPDPHRPARGARGWRPGRR